MKNGYKIAIATSLTLAGVILATYRLRAGTLARSFVGIGEEGVNASFTNKAFEDMMKKSGWKSGEEWCMYFAKSVHMNTFKKDKDKIDKILNGSSQLSWANANNDTTDTYKIITSGKPKIGDIVIWQNTTSTGKGHAGVVIRNSGDNFITVEGNTNLAGASSGENGLVKTRPLQYGKTMPNSNLKLLGFIRKKQHIFGL